MDIRNWPLDRIMQLPDWCFGRRWMVGVGAFSNAITTVYDISEAGLPERIVIWEIGILFCCDVGTVSFVSLALGDQLPTTDTKFFANQRLFKDIGRLEGSERVLSVCGVGSFCIRNIKKPVETGGRRLIGRFLNTVAKTMLVDVIINFSSLPKEVPDWLSSGQGRGLL